jgi:putative membrane protein
MLKRMVMHWAIGVVAVLVAVWLAKQLGLKLEWPQAWRIVIFVPVLAFANAVIAPVLKILALPVSCLTLGLFGFVVNALVFWMAGAATGAQMTFLSALFGSVVVTLVGGVLSRLVREDS